MRFWSFAGWANNGCWLIDQSTNLARPRFCGFFLDLFMTVFVDNQLNCGFQGGIFAFDESLSSKFVAESHWFQSVEKAVIWHELSHGRSFSGEFRLVFLLFFFLLQFFNNFLRRFDLIGIFEAILQNLIDAWLGGARTLELIKLFLILIKLIFLLEPFFERYFRYSKQGTFSIYNAHSFRFLKQNDQVMGSRFNTLDVLFEFEGRQVIQRYWFRNFQRPFDLRNIE